MIFRRSNAFRARLQIDKDVERAYQCGVMRVRITSLSQTRLGAAGLWLGAWCFLLLVGLANAQSSEETQKQFLRGDYDAVIRAAQKKIHDGAYEDEWRILLVKSLLATGRYDEAHSNAVAAVAESSYNLSLRLLARETELYHNDPAGARLQLENIKELIQRRFGDFQNDDAPSLGQALLLLGIEPRYRSAVRIQIDGNLSDINRPRIRRIGIAVE